MTGVRISARPNLMPSLTQEVLCANCGNPFQKKVSLVKRALRIGRANCCSKTCGPALSMKNRTVEERQKMAEHLMKRGFVGAKGKNHPRWGKRTDLNSVIRKAKQKTYQQNRRKEFPERHNARNAVYRAVKSGKMIRPDNCERCDSSSKCLR